MIRSTCFPTDKVGRLAAMIFPWSTFVAAGKGDAPWPQFRGPAGDGVVAGKHVPLTLVVRTSEAIDRFESRGR